MIYQYKFLKKYLLTLILGLTLYLGIVFILSATSGASDSPNSILHRCYSYLPSDFITNSEVKTWLSSSKKKAETRRWNRVLASLGEDNGYKAMNVGQAKKHYVKYKTQRWARTVDTLKALRKCNKDLAKQSQAVETNTITPAARVDSDQMVEIIQKPIGSNLVLQADIVDSIHINQYRWKQVILDTGSTCDGSVFSDDDTEGRTLNIIPSMRENYRNNKMVCFEATYLEDQTVYYGSEDIKVNDYFPLIDITISQEISNDDLVISASDNHPMTTFYNYVIMPLYSPCDVQLFNANAYEGNRFTVYKTQEDYYASRKICFKALASNNDYGIKEVEIDLDQLNQHEISVHSRIALYEYEVDELNQTLDIRVKKARPTLQNYGYEQVVINQGMPCDESAFADQTAVSNGELLQIHRINRDNYNLKQVCFRAVHYSWDFQDPPERDDDGNLKMVIVETHYAGYKGVDIHTHYLDPDLVVQVEDWSFWPKLFVRAYHSNLDGLATTNWEGEDLQSNSLSYVYGYGPAITDENDDPISLRQSARSQYGKYRVTLTNCPVDESETAGDGWVVFDRKALKQNPNCKVSFELLEVKYHHPNGIGENKKRQIVLPINAPAAEVSVTTQH